jgi:flagellin
VDREALQLELAQLVQEIDQIADTTEFNQMRLLDGTRSTVAIPQGVNTAGGNVTNQTAVGANTLVMNDGRTRGSLVIQAGANHGQTMSITIGPMNARGLGVQVLNARELGTANSLDTDMGQGPVGPTGWIGADDRVRPEVGVDQTRVNINNRANAATSIAVIDRALNCVSMARANLGAYQNRLDFKIQNLNNQAENVSAAESRIRDADMAAMMTEFTRNNILFQASTAMLAQANALPQSVLQLLG